MVEDLREEFIRDYAFKALAAGAVYEDNYLLGTALARPLLAYGQVQVRARPRRRRPGPRRHRQGERPGALRGRPTRPSRPTSASSRPGASGTSGRAKTRSAYAAAHNVPVDQSPRDLFSRDGNLWHLSHEGGNLEDTWNAPLKEMFKLTVDPEDAPNTPQEVTIAFEHGRPGGASTARRWGRWPSSRSSTASRARTAWAASTSWRTVSSASSRRGVYETPAGTVLHVAHRELERLVLDRNTLHFKQTVSVRYAQLIYDGLWFSTLREALAAFVDYTEKEVTGEVRVRLFKGRAEAVGRRSPRSLYRQDLATFGEGMAYDHKDAEGFIRLFGLPERVRALTRDLIPVDVKAVEVTRGRPRRGGRAR